MAYFLFFIVLLFFSIVEYYTKNKNKVKALFYISGGLLLLFCALRSGVGFDYESYRFIYESLPTSLFTKESLQDIKGEYLFLQYFVLLRHLGIPYMYASSITLAIIIILLLRFIRLYSPYKCFSILILYAWHFTYIFSTLRQGLALALILGVAMPLLDKDKYVKYYILVLITTLIHTSAIVCALFPLCFKFSSLLQKKTYFILVAACLPLAFFSNFLLTTFAGMVEYTEMYLESSVSVIALLNRSLATIIIYFWCKSDNVFFNRLKSVYLAGFLVYLIFAHSELIASRIVAYFKIYEILLIPLVLMRIPKKYYPLFILPMSIYLGFMLMNIIDAIASLTGYYSDGWAYPYKTIFDYN